MPPAHAPIRVGPAERLLAWLYTGPLGHLYGFLADLSSLWFAWAALRLRERRRGYSKR